MTTEREKRLIEALRHAMIDINEAGVAHLCSSLDEIELLLSQERSSVPDAEEEQQWTIYGPTTDPERTRWFEPGLPADTSLTVVPVSYRDAYEHLREAVEEEEAGLSLTEGKRLHEALSESAALIKGENE